MRSLVEHLCSVLLSQPLHWEGVATHIPHLPIPAATEILVIGNTDSSAWSSTGSSSPGNSGTVPCLILVSLSESKLTMTICITDLKGENNGDQKWVV